MSRLIPWTIIVLAALGAASLVGMPLLAREAAERIEIDRPEALPKPPELPEKRGTPIIPVEELNEKLRLPRIDESPTDEHSQASFAAYRQGDYEKAFEEAVLALDPTPLRDNELYRNLTTSDQGLLADRVEEASGRQAMRHTEQALSGAVDDKDPHSAARLNNVAAMMVLYYNEPGTELDAYMGALLAQEMAFQAADLDASYCPALLNLTLIYGAPHFFGLENIQPSGFGSELWTNYYPVGGCEDPALAYYLAQVAISPKFQESTGTTLSEALTITEALASTRGWDGLARSLRGDAYYWQGVYAGERTIEPRPFTAKHYLELALHEYEAALKLQPDDSTIHHGMARTYRQLGERRLAIREAEMALEAAPNSAPVSSTLAELYSENGDFAVAARVSRNLLASERAVASPLNTLFYSAISHGSDHYSELRFPGEAGPVLFDDSELIPRSEPRPYNNEPSSSEFTSSFAGKLESSRSELQHYALIRDDLLSRNFLAFDEDLSRVPEATRNDWHTLLLIAMRRFEEPSEGSSSPATRAAIEDFIEAFPRDQYRSTAVEQRGGDLFYREAGNFFRQHGLDEEALRIYRAWQRELERDGKNALPRLAEVENLLGEANFLAGRETNALEHFDRAVELRPDWPPYRLRQAFLYEQLARYDDAEHGYRETLEAMRRPAVWIEDYDTPERFYFPENYMAARHLGDVLMRQAETHRLADDKGAAEEKYSRAIEAYRLSLSFPRSGESLSAPAVNNLGVAMIARELLKKDSEDQNYEESIRVLRTLTQPSGAPAAWKNPPTPDEHNPFFRLSLGWAYELNDESEKAKEQYLRAVGDDPSFYPALNDLGVLAANDGDVEEAKRYFKTALNTAKGKYDYAAHNLGVALLRSGPEGFLAGQHYLSRAAALNPALADTSYDYAFDNELYFLNLSLGTSVPPDLQFVAHAERSTFLVSAGAVFLLLLGIVRRTAIGKGRDMITGKVFDLARSRFGGLLSRLLVGARDRYLGFLQLGTMRSAGLWMTLVAILLTAPAVAVVQGWSLLWDDSAVKLLMLGTLIYVSLVSLLVHHAGHALVALRYRTRVKETPWPTGIAQAVALAAAGGPFIAPIPITSIDGETGERQQKLIYLAGPLASIGLATVMYATYLLSPVPVLKFGATLNLALAAASLLTVPPLDGAAVGAGHYSRWTFWAAIFVTVMSALVAISSFF